MRLFVVGLVLNMMVQMGAASNAEIKFTTVFLPGEHAPKHVLAVWIEDATGSFVASVAVYAEKRKGYLKQWSASSRGLIGDAVTGATLSAHKAHVENWNGKDFSGVEVPDGSYFLRMEMSSHDDTPDVKLAFNKTSGISQKTFNDETYFKNISVTYAGAATPISNVSNNVSSFKAYVNSNEGLLNLSYNIQNADRGSITLYDIQGRFVKEFFAGEFPSGEHLKSILLPTTVKSGLYILELRTPHDKVSKKIMVK